MHKKGQITEAQGSQENTVGLTILAHQDLIAQNPDLVRRFVKATVRSFEAAMKEPEASVKAGQKVKQDIETDLSLEQLKVGIGLMKSPKTQNLPIGHFAAADWQEAVDLMKQYQDLQTDKKAEDFFTNDLLPKP